MRCEASCLISLGPRFFISAGNVAEECTQIALSMLPWVLASIVIESIYYYGDEAKTTLAGKERSVGQENGGGSRVLPVGVTLVKVSVEAWDS